MIKRNVNYHETFYESKVEKIETLRNISKHCNIDLNYLKSYWLHLIYSVNAYLLLFFVLSET